MAKFFISYSRSVKDEISKVVDLLRASGHEVWWDDDIPTIADWWATILKHIEWCEVFIFVTSEKSVQSAYCLAELIYARDRQRPILPFMLDDKPAYVLPTELPRRNQWLLYNGDPVRMLEQINVSYNNIDWNLHKDMDTHRPPEPMTGGKTIAKQYQEARRLANDKKFEESKRIFRNIKTLDYDEWGRDCDEWLNRLTKYASIVELEGDRTTFERARREWKVYVREYGNEFDPHGIKTKLTLEHPSKLIPQFYRIIVIILFTFLLSLGIYVVVNTYTMFNSADFATATPNVIDTDCTKPGLPPIQTDQIKITVNSIDIMRTNVELNNLYIYVTLENLTSSELKLDLYQNLRILQSQSQMVIAAPVMESSSWSSSLLPLAKADQMIKLSQISEIMGSIDMQFLESIVDGVTMPGIRINGIPSSCFTNLD